MTIYFAGSSKGFYNSEIHSSIPSDAIEITTEQYIQLLNEQSLGREIVVENKQVVTKQKIADGAINTQNERAWRDSELVRADYELNKVQDSDANSVGSVGVWREYRKLLRAWPQSVDFPDNSKRPVAPDASV